MDARSLERRIGRIKRQIAALGPLRPGTLYARHSVCGTPGCRCARAGNPVRHGPYSYLSYTRDGRSHTEFVRRGQVAAVRRQVANYGRLMQLVRELVDCNMALCRAQEEQQS